MSGCITGKHIQRCMTCQNQELVRGGNVVIITLGILIWDTQYNQLNESTHCRRVRNRIKISSLDTEGEKGCNIISKSDVWRFIIQKNN